MRIDTLLPAQFSTARVERIDLAILIAEDEGGGSTVGNSKRRGPYRPLGLISPVQATRLCINGIDRAAGAADEDSAIEHGRRPESGHVAGKSKRPFEL